MKISFITSKGKSLSSFCFASPDRKVCPLIMRCRPGRPLSPSDITKLALYQYLDVILIRLATCFSSEEQVPSHPVEAFFRISPGGDMVNLNVDCFQGRGSALRSPCISIPATSCKHDCTWVDYFVNIELCGTASEYTTFSRFLTDYLE